MSIPGAGSPLFLSAAAAADAAAYQIDRSLRFNDGDSAYLSRTPSSVGNKKTFTWSGWIKRTEFGGNKTFFSSANSNTSNPRTDWQFNNDKLYIGFNPSGSSWLEVITNRVFRDPSAWYHIVVAVDTTQGTNTDRVKVYVNGVRETSFSTYSTFTQDSGVHINSAVQHSIGRYEAGDSNYFPGYLAEVYFIDGQALAASDFGQYDSNNVWQPKEFSGSYTAAATGTTTSLSQTGWQTSDQANIWDGDTNTRSVGYADNQVGTVTFDPPLTNVTKVEIYQQDYVHYLNGSSVTTSENGNPGWHVLYNNSSSPITLTSLGNSYTNNTQTVDIFAIRINDSIVDSQTWTPPSGVGLQGTGENSFYLKFAQNVSNSALGTDSSGNSNTWTVNNITAIESKWSDYLTTTGTFASNQGPEKSFDNSLSAADVPALDAGHPLTWSPPGGLAYSSKVEIYVGAVSGFTYSLNGASAVTATTNAWNTVATGSGTIDTLVFDRGVNETHGPHAIRVDNVVLVDGTTPSNTDSLIDTPTNYTSTSGNNGGNYCTLSPLKNAQTLSNGNLDVVGGSSWQRSVGTIGMYSGKYYWEYTITASNEHLIGVGPPDMQLSGNLGAGDPPGSGYGTELGFVNGTGANGSWSNTGASGAGDVIAIAFDADNGNMYVYKNGTALNSGAASHTGLVMPQIPCVSLNGSSRSGTINFGQRPFKYTPPTGYSSLVSTNLSDPTIADGSTAFDAALYTGNGSTQSITGLNHSPDFVWIKCRSAAKSHSFFDSVRGATKLLKCDVTQAESTQAGGVTSFDSNGFSIGSRAGNNENNATFVAWAWDAGTSTVSNTDGSITSSVRASQTNGVSIVGFTGDGSGTDTIGHGLNATPELIILKDRNNAYNWLVYTQQIDGSWDYLRLNTTDAKSDSSYSAATSSVFSYGTDAADYIAYCFTPVAGFSAFGSYEGTGSASTAAFVYTGMRPRWILVKNADDGTSASDWFIYDTARTSFNSVDDALFPNRNIAEASETSHAFDILSNGFRVRSTSTSGLSNKSGNTYLWAAFAEHPQKFSRAR